MILVGIQFFGGRGSGGASGARGGGRAAGSGGTANKPFQVPKLSKAEVNSLSRSSLETLATALYANEAMSRGLSKQEGVRQAKSLLSGNTTAQLKKYINKRM